MEDMKWFNDLKSDEKKYIVNHPDPSHIISFLKQGFGFYKSVLRGYEEYVLEDIEIKETGFYGSEWWIQNVDRVRGHLVNRDITVIEPISVS